MTLHNTFYLMAVGLSTLSIIVNAEVVLDGTLGTSATLQGPHFAIDAGFGQQVGTNLFHSFESFNLNSNESATFTGPANISNVINRVTGGQPSSIDGLLSSKVPNADVYFINPAGVMFGPNAKINLPASLYMSSGDYLKLGENGRFDATMPDNSLLTTAPPSAFGFLDNTPNRITVAGSQLVLSNNEKITRLLSGENVPPDTLALVGGDIKIENGQLISFGNDAHLVSVASVAEVPLDPSQFPDDAFTRYGTITITDTLEQRNFGNIDTSGLGGGEIFVRAGQFFLDNAWVFADTYGDKVGRGININVNEALTLQNASRITTEVYAIPQQFLFGKGNAGSINIKAENINLTDGSQIQSSSRTGGIAGDVTLAVQGTLSIKGADSTGNYRSGILTNSLNTGAGGEMSIFADALIMDDGATMRAETRGFGEAGNLSIQANTLTLSNGSKINVSTGHRTAFQGTGKAGKLAIVANESVSIGGGERSSGLVSNTFTQGQGGKIAITSPDVTVHKKGYIQAGTQRDGNAGSIILNVDTLNLTQGGSIVAMTTGNGLGGDVKVRAQNIRFSEGCSLSASSLGQGDAGQINLQADNIHLIQESIISTSAENAGGGNIIVNSSDLLYLNEGQMSTSVHGGVGNGGNITIDNPQFVVLNQGQIKAQADEGHGGDIYIKSEQFIKSNESLISASSRLGIDGNVQIDSPIVDLGAMLVVLPDGYVEAQLRKCTFEEIDNPSTLKVDLTRELIVPFEEIVKGSGEIIGK
ncbi:filamentous hemagglutinin N-terminal domain-containing protein [Candidatus Parabeggiatoa sp. HSG14]|uniref:two-partner secretion domain-containing protein n=1 Tax=Candidatus Parabeggiatoa sp. HSG14 TaxID=3055593 RepID=UPI0025A72511|nr:filamentous hemagglutinin N-terminal domain-containing protein [Thiotrichales bacterium HSG14]